VQKRSQGLVMGCEEMFDIITDDIAKEVERLRDLKFTSSFNYSSEYLSLYRQYLIEHKQAFVVE
jgi:hypothetical protein